MNYGIRKQPAILRRMRKLPSPTKGLETNYDDMGGVLCAICTYIEWKRFKIKRSYSNDVEKILIPDNLLVSDMRFSQWNRDAYTRSSVATIRQLHWTLNLLWAEPNSLPLIEFPINPNDTWGISIATLQAIRTLLYSNKFRSNHAHFETRFCLYW